MRGDLVYRGFVASLVACLLVVGLWPHRPPADFPHPSRIAVMVLENRSKEQVIGSPNAPFINRLVRHGALATDYFAVGHPSLPNYIAMTTGAMQDVHSNCTSCATDQPSLVNQLDSAGISWRAYFESIHHDGDAAVSPSRAYNKHYNPFIYTETVRSRRADRARETGFSALRRDLAANRLPRFSWIAPNVRHDGHHHSLRAADAFAARLVPSVLRALGPHGVLYLTWDESVDSDPRGMGGVPGGGRVALIAAGGAAAAGARVDVPANHYALLRTIETNLGLRLLGQAGAGNTPLLGGLLKPS